MTCCRRLAAWNEARVWDQIHLPSPVDRARPGSKRHLIVDGQGIPLAVSLTAATATTSPNSCPCWTRSRPWPTAATTPGKYRRLRRAYSLI
jgi:hypothetical protein